MNVILLDNVENLGSIGDLVKVKPGYGRNYLLPRGKAALATPENIKAMEARRAELEKHAAEELAAARKRAETINGMELVIKANAGAEDKLFGSVGTRDISEAVTALGCEVDKSEVRLPDGPMRELGEYEIAIQVHGDVTAMVAVAVVAEQGNA